jgi:hypothetical protein
MSSNFRLCFSTRFHDWVNGPAFGRCLDHCAAAGWLGDVSWVATDWNFPAKHLHLSRGPQLSGKIISRLPPVKRKARTLSIGGEQPWKWSLELYLSPFDVAADRLDGMNLFKLEFFSDEDQTGELWKPFVAAVDEGFTEYGRLAIVESEERLLPQFRNDPVFTGPIFPYVAWGNYLGRTTLETFNREQIGELPAYRVDADRSDGGMLLIASQSPAAAATPEGEQLLVALTERFRAARK